MDEIIHELDGENYHRLVISGVPGEWFPPKEIAHCGVYYAVQQDTGGVDFREVVGGDYPVVFTFAAVPFASLEATEDRPKGRR